MARGEGLGNMLTLFEKIMGEQRQRQEVREDRAYRTGMAKWMEEARAKEQRELLNWQSLMEYGKGLNTQAIAEETKAAQYGVLIKDTDKESMSDGFFKLIQGGMLRTQQRANTLRERQKQFDTKMEEAAIGIQQLQTRISKAQDVSRRYEIGFGDEALAASIYEYGKKTSTEQEGTIEAERLDAMGIKQAFEALQLAGNITTEQAVDPVWRKGISARAMGMSDKGVKQSAEWMRAKAAAEQATTDRKYITAKEKEGARVVQKANLRGYDKLTDTEKATYGAYLGIKGGEEKELRDLVVDWSLEAKNLFKKSKERKEYVRKKMQMYTTGIRPEGMKPKTETNVEQPPPNFFTK